MPQIRHEKKKKRNPLWRERRRFTPKRYKDTNGYQSLGTFNMMLNNQMVNFQGKTSGMQLG